MMNLNLCITYEFFIITQSETEKDRDRKDRETMLFDFGLWGIDAHASDII
jgi:hypothetical protein